MTGEGADRGTVEVGRSPVGVLGTGGIGPRMATGEEGGNGGREGGAAVRSVLGRGMGTSGGKSVAGGKGEAGRVGGVGGVEGGGKAGGGSGTVAGRGIGRGTCAGKG